MRVMQYDGYGDPAVIHAGESPKPAPGADEVLVKVAAVGINPADTKWRQGMFNHFAPLTFPFVGGYDIAGVVEAVGPGVSGLKVGQRVTTMARNGAYAEYATAPAANTAPIPDDLDFARAASLPTAALTGVQMIEEALRPEPSQSVLITGAIGAVGRFATYAAVGLGARVVAAVRPSQADEARAIGAAEVVFLGQQAWTGAPFDHVCDTVGGAAVADLCRHLAPGGRISTAATTPVPAEGLSAEPVFFIVRGDAGRLEALARDVAAGKLGAPIARRLPLADAAEAHRLMEAGGLVGKIILEP